jgi:hypothetical protein
MKKTYAQLMQENIQLRGQLPCMYKAALRDINKASVDHLMASGCLITLTALGGRELITPIVIKDGLSLETIQALTSDITRSLTY